MSTEPALCELRNVTQEYAQPKGSGTLRVLSDVSLDVLDETGEIVQAMAFRAGAYNDRTPLMSEIRKDGIDL